MDKIPRLAHNISKNKSQKFPFATSFILFNIQQMVEKGTGHVKFVTVIGLIH